MGNLVLTRDSGVVTELRHLWSAYELTHPLTVAVVSTKGKGPSALFGGKRVTQKQRPVRVFLELVQVVSEPIPRDAKKVSTPKKVGPRVNTYRLLAPRFYRQFVEGTPGQDRSAGVIALSKNPDPRFGILLIKIPLTLMIPQLFLFLSLLRFSAGNTPSLLSGFSPPRNRNGGSMIPPLLSTPFRVPTIWTVFCLSVVLVRFLLKLPRLRLERVVRIKLILYECIILVGVVSLGILTLSTSHLWEGFCLPWSAPRLMNFSDMAAAGISAVTAFFEQLPWWRSKPT